MIKVKNDSNDELKTWLNKWTRNIKKNIKATPKMPDVYQINTQNKKDTLEWMNWSGILSLNLYLDTFLIQGVHLKLCFFPNSLQLIHEGLIGVYSLSYWLDIFVQQIAAQCWQRGYAKRSQNIDISLEKNTIFNEHPVCPTFR